MSVTYVVCIVGWIAGWLVFGRPRRLGPAGPGTGPPMPVTVLIPARNESASLGGLLGDLERTATDGPAARVVVLDDASEDDTAEIARRSAGVELVEVPDLPRGWAGKCWACDRGVEAVSNSAGRSSSGARDDDLLVFLDADVRLRSDALECLDAEHRRAGGLVSVQPWHVTERPYEQLSALFNVIALMGTGAGSASPKGAFGPVLVTSRRDYRAVGGHAAVRGEIVEDLALAANYRAAGLPVTVSTGGERIRFRMYPTGIGDLIDGWTKNFALGAGATSVPRLAAIVCWIAAMGSAAAALVEHTGDLAAWSVAVVAYLSFVVQLLVMFRQVGRFGLVSALAYPLLLVAFVGVFGRSLWRTHVRRSVSWRGRTIAVSSRRS